MGHTRDSDILGLCRWWNVAGQALWSTSMPGVGKVLWLGPGSSQDHCSPWSWLPSLRGASTGRISSVSKPWGSTASRACPLLLWLRGQKWFVCLLFVFNNQRLFEARTMFWPAPRDSNQTQGFFPGYVPKLLSLLPCSHAIFFFFQINGGFPDGLWGEWVGGEGNIISLNFAAGDR